MAAGVYIYKPISGSIAVLSPGKPCGEPMSYSIGAVDSQFSITADDVTDAAKNAAALWNNGGQRVLIQQDNGDESEPDITVNFVYDERQARTDGELRFREEIRSYQIRLDQLQEQHELKRKQFDEQTQSYLELADRTTKELNTLNEWVAEKNEEGGFTESEYEQFLQRKSQVEQNQEKIIKERERLDQFAHTINREMEELNKKFNEHNRLIEKYNEDFAGDMRFTKATYQRQGNRGVITVNQFVNQRELSLILAHEMGHALGLDHLTNPQSVMYGSMGAQSLYPEVQLSDEDREAINGVCR